MATAAQRDFARSIYAAAQKATDIAPEFVTAQAILESGWGKSRIGKFNLFGITRGSNWKGHTVLILTHEYFNTPNHTFTAPEKVVSCIVLNKLTPLKSKRSKNLCLITMNQKKFCYYISM